jgi:hypothetical protein
MYSKFELLIIFNSIQSIEEYDFVCEKVHWMVDNGYQERTTFLYEISLRYFNKFYN